MGDDERLNYVLVGGENIDATLGGSILRRPPLPEGLPHAFDPLEWI
jgi:hypothetical protein